MVNFMIFKASVWNILDISSYFCNRLSFHTASHAQKPYFELSNVIKIRRVVSDTNGHYNVSYAFYSLRVKSA
jgi:hypothetical protein